MRLGKVIQVENVVDVEDDFSAPSRQTVTPAEVTTVDSLTAAEASAVSYKDYTPA